MNEILTFEELRKITGRGVSASRAQVASDLTKMKMKFKLNAKGEPISSLAAYNRYIGLRDSSKQPVDNDSQTGFRALSSNG